MIKSPHTVSGGADRDDSGPLLAGQTGWFDFSTLWPGAPVKAVLSQREAPSVPAPLSEHREDLAHQLGLALKTIAAPHQVHGHRVEWARPGQLHGETDGLFTDDEQVVLTLQVADCAPIYFYHRPSRLRGLVHAGWRGVGAGVVTASTDFMQAQGVALDQVEVIIGPAIERSCYEVGPEVVEPFPPTVWRPHSAGKFQLDLVAAIREQLTGAGVLAGKVTGVDVCTRCDSRCHSYRRDGQQAGRMIAYFYKQNSS
ncbi:MAG: polyphenol oxidase family protein [Candidatus Marinimicrobia bacterium]|nr:polyphenol oxidase family protein [Candidatus Neomarinimicrobiota bacterium]